MSAKQKLREKLESIIEIATVPHVMAKLLVVVEDERSAATELANVVASDQAVTARLLRTVNSVHYALSRRVSTVLDAVIILGYEEVRKTALAISVVDSFKGSRSSAKYRRELWRHNLACACTADQLQKRLRKDHPDVRECYVAGLMHDIGKSVLDQFLPISARTIRELVAEQGVELLEAEGQVLEATHCEIGAWVAQNWDFPDVVVESVRYHHEPDALDNPHLTTYVTHISDFLSNRLYALGDQKPEEPSACVEARERLGLYDQIVAEVESDLEKQKDLFDIILEDVA